MKNLRISIIKYVLSLATLVILLSPAASHAALDYSGLVQCDGVVSQGYDANGVPTGIAKGEEGRNRECNFAALMNTIHYIIRWIFYLSIPIFVGMCAYAGIMYMTPNPGNRSSANAMLWAGIKGFLIMLCAYFIVATLVDWLVAPEFKSAANSLLEQRK